MKAKASPRARAESSAISGPIHTRRLGYALMMNLGTRPEKRCTWNCIYCPWKTKDQARCHPSAPGREEIIEELSRKLSESRKQVDSVVLAGISEPTVHPEFAEIVEDVVRLRRKLGARWLIDCISNGSALDKEKIRKACDSIDRTWIKLDCATNKLFKSTNLPASKLTTIEKQLELISKLRSPFIQTTFWRNSRDSELQNWSPENLQGLLEIYARLKPGCVHLTTLRPSSVFSKLRPIYYENLEAFAQRVGDLGIPVEVFP
ncbi:MAG: radical SAM protein [Oligoflexia bacterium]|nr:radical SAM protein [Oligoflexia bacterium]